MKNSSMMVPEIETEKRKPVLKLRQENNLMA
jgi:hypothetical protein